MEALVKTGKMQSTDKSLYAVSRSHEIVAVNSSTPLP